MTATLTPAEEAEALARIEVARGEDREHVEAKLTEFGLSAEKAEFEYRMALGAVQRQVAEEHIAEAQAAAEEATPEGEALEVVTARHAIANPRPRKLGLWGEILVPGEAAGPVARGGVGKTTFTRTVMLRSAEGTGEFLDRPFHAGPVRWLYLTREGNGGYWLDRLHSAAEALGTSDDALDRIHLVEYADDCGLYLTTPADVNRISEILQRMRDEGTPIHAVAIDPFTDFKAGSDNDDEAMQAAFASIKKLCREFDVAAWVPHHSSQNGTGLDASRGSTKYEGTVNAQMNLTDGVTDSRGKALPETVRKLQLEKNRYGRKTTHYLDFDEDTEVYTERAKPGLATDALRAMHDAVEEGADGASIKDMAKAAKASPSGIRKAVKSLIAEGKAEEAGKLGRDTLYQPTEGGNASLGMGF